MLYYLTTKVSIWMGISAHARCAPLEVRMKRVFVLFLMILGAVCYASFNVSGSSPQAADNAKIAIAYSSNLLGYTEPCG
jgi:hypothetical protein